MKWLDKESSALVQAFVMDSINSDSFANKDGLVLVERLACRSSGQDALLASLRQISLGEKSDGIFQTLKARSALSSHNILSIYIGGSSSIDPVGEILHKLYGVPKSDCWKKIFAKEYAHANKMLMGAHSTLHLDRSAWIAYTDSFNDVLTRQIAKLLTAKFPLIN